MNPLTRIKELNERFKEKIGWKILDSYLLKKMLGSVLFSISLLMVVVVVFDVSENIHRFMGHNIPAKEVITGYYFNLFGSLQNSRHATKSSPFSIMASASTECWYLTSRARSLS